MAETEQAVTEQVSTEHSPGPTPGEQPVGGASAARDAAAEAAVGADGTVASEDASNPAVAVASTAPQSEDEQVLEGDVVELLAAVAKRDEYLALAQRTQADFENYRKRVARESAVAQERGVAKLARELLPALDNLDRALDAADQQDPLLEGVRLVRSELAAALGRVGVESFTPLGEPFDPAEHEAIVQQAIAGAQSGTVAEVYQPGYRLSGTIIRPARVVVAE